MSSATPSGFPPNTPQRGPHYGPPNSPRYGPQHGPRYGPQQGTAPQFRQGSPADRVITIVLICLAPLVCVGASFWGLFSVMATASCGIDCGTPVDIAIPLMILSPWVILLVTPVWALVRLVRKKPAVWVMLIGLGVATVVYVAANVMLFTTVN